MYKPEPDNKTNLMSDNIQLTAGIYVICFGGGVCDFSLIFLLKEVDIREGT